MSMTSSSSERLSYFSAVSFNNQGADLLLRGDYQGSIKTLTVALRAAKQSFIECEKAKISDDVDFDAPADLAAQLVSPLPQVGGVHAAKDIARYFSTGFVYQHPFRIDTACLRLQDSLYVESHPILSAIVIYNLALANHFMAYEVGCKCDHQRNFLRKAIHFYEYAYELHRTETTIEPNPLLLVAILNNLARANSFLGETSRAQECFQRLLSCILLLVDAHVATDFSDFDGFLSSVFHLLISPSSQSAPAA